jgi:NADH dehydrogenase [ubiquinone] 1 alpha subcomplex assembly factor 6
MTGLSYPAEFVRRYDHDRFITAIFAPPRAREHLFALYALNIEIAKTGEIVSESLIGQMRLQWWRDVLERLYAGGDVAHEVARPLGAAIRECGLPEAAFDRLIEAREFDLERQPPPDLAAMLRYAEGTNAPLLELALKIVAPPAAEGSAASDSARLAGTAWGVTGLLRAVPFHARQRRLYLPADRLSAANVRIDRLFDLKPDPGLGPVVRDIAEAAADLLWQARRAFKAVPRRARSPLLVTSMAHVYLHDLRRAAWDPFALHQGRGHPLMAARLGWNAATGRY